MENMAPVEGVEKDTDTLGSRGPWESGLYPLKISMAYVKKSDGGATAVVLHMKDANDKELRQTLWVMSGNAKGNKNYYETKDGAKKELPGYSLFRSLCLMTVGAEPNAVAYDDGIVKVWNSEKKAEIDTSVPILTGLLKQDIIAGVVKQVVDKNVKDGAGNYVASGETREENELDKFFHSGTRMTLAEATAGLKAGVFIDDWEAQNKGETRMRAKGGSADGAAPAAAAGGTPAPDSIFGQ
jgi:hypothetical protein